MGYTKEIEIMGNKFSDAYFRLLSVTVRNLDFEEYVNLEDGSQKVQWITRQVGVAEFLIYGDEIARENRVEPLKRIMIEFTPDFTGEHESLFSQAYLALRKHSIYGEKLPNLN